VVVKTAVRCGSCVSLPVRVLPAGSGGDRDRQISVPVETIDGVEYVLVEVDTGSWPWYMNHECRPSAEILFTLVDGKVCVVARTTRELALGDELTMYYKDYLTTRNKPCRCGCVPHSVRTRNWRLRIPAAHVPNVHVRVHLAVCDPPAPVELRVRRDLDVWHLVNKTLPGYKSGRVPPLRPPTFVLGTQGHMLAALNEGECLGDIASRQGPGRRAPHFCSEHTCLSTHLVLVVGYSAFQLFPVPLPPQLAQDSRDTWIACAPICLVSWCMLAV